METGYANIEDELGKVIGRIDLETMRVVAPNREVDNLISAREAIYMRHNGIRSSLSVVDPKKKRRR